MRTIVLLIFALPLLVAAAIDRDIPRAAQDAPRASAGLHLASAVIVRPFNLGFPSDSGRTCLGIRTSLWDEEDSTDDYLGDLLWLSLEYRGASGSDRSPWSTGTQHELGRYPASPRPLRC